MNIVVLDGHTLNPGDISWDELRNLGSVTIYDRTPAGLIQERIGDAEIVLTNKTPLTREVLEAAERLRYVGVLATGYNVVDIEAAAARGITVTNVPAYGTESVAQFVFALLLELCHQVGRHGDSVRLGEWAQTVDFSYSLSPQIELWGKTMGIVGYGRIGRQVARLAEAFGLRVLVSGRPGRDGGAEDGGARRVPLEQLLAESDVVSLHCPLTAETEELINRERLALMKPSAFLINTARGGLLREQDVADALNEGRLAGAALDVLAAEPPSADHPLVHAPRCIITPHMAWAAVEARERLMSIAVGNVAAFLEGRPANTVVPHSR
ncbi:D-2-hydroxyacid dehydrogenase [Paenibacillus sp. XY044]|uniref:D-2-hydroxyacid dehydrogenase n=1 Tax=Paenibacillus sp. XY044 TaxID=2026089 RepID=UPI000B99894F|nr:D-2-hydroxyacid dehydrogenase [Paenibacillus sp. XY044]OZB91597.1 glycerate dehydrogenase [Paenibacillus sp. XY044]